MFLSFNRFLSEALTASAVVSLNQSTFCFKCESFASLEFQEGFYNQLLSFPYAPTVPQPFFSTSAAVVHILSTLIQNTCCVAAKHCGLLMLMWVFKLVSTPFCDGFPTEWLLDLVFTNWLLFEIVETFPELAGISFSQHLS